MDCIVGRVVIAGDIAADVMSVQDINVRIVVHTGCCLAAEEFAVCWIDFAFEGIHQLFHVIFVDIRAVLRPEVGMRRDITQGKVALRCSAVSEFEIQNFSWSPT